MELLDILNISERMNLKTFVAVIAIIIVTIIATNAKRIGEIAVQKLEEVLGSKHKKELQQKQINYILEHKLFSFCFFNIKQFICNIGEEIFHGHNISSEQAKKRIYCIQKFATINLGRYATNYMEHSKAIIEAVKQNDVEKIKALNNKTEWIGRTIKAYEEWYKECKNERLNMVFIDRIYKYHYKNEANLIEKMDDIFVKNYFYVSELEKVCQFLDYMYSVIQHTTASLEEIAILNHDVTDSFERWEIPNDR